ncbi:MAG TPA: hypothetical protein VMQ56_17640 [Terracidiphilus sp.]|jgi:hypothetical protein|nr:hypothetical protein [Terracidiphilus sp.]
MPEKISQSTVKFHLIKGNFFRVIHADGVIGGLTPYGGIFLSLYSERGAIPQMIEQDVNPDGTLGEEKRREGKEGLVREVEVGVMLNGPTAKGIADWLLKQVAILEAIQPESQPEQELTPSGTSSSMEEMP